MPEFITHFVEVPKDEEIVGVITRKKAPIPKVINAYSYKSKVASKEQVFDFIEEVAGELSYREVSSLWDPADPRIQGLAVGLFDAGLLDDEVRRYDTFQDVDTYFREIGNVPTTKSRSLTRELFRTFDQAILTSPK